jgi:hypothetical protein
VTTPIDSDWELRQLIPGSELKVHLNIWVVVEAGGYEIVLRVVIFITIKMLKIDRNLACMKQVDDLVE